jgi:hypothetical protein
MTATATPLASAPQKLRAKDVMKETEALYKRLFGRAIVIAGAVFAVVELADTSLGVGGVGGLALAVFSIALTVAGYALVEGALVQLVRDLHEDGDSRSSFKQIFERARARLKPLVSVSLLTASGIGLGSLLLLIPGVVLLTRWAVAVPVVMLEDKSAREAMRRSRELVRGNGRAVCNVMLSVAIMTGVVNILFAILARGHGFVGFWLAGIAAATLTAPYAAHAVTVLYYRLTEPEREVALEPGKRWQSVWDAQRASVPAVVLERGQP